MITDLFVKFLMWMEKHEDLVFNIIIFVSSCLLTLMIINTIALIPSFIKLIWG